MAKLRRTIGHKIARDWPGVSGLLNAREFIVQNTTYFYSAAQDDGGCFDNAAFFHMTCDLAEFENQEQGESSKYDTIRSAFGQEEHHEGLVE